MAQSRGKKFEDRFKQDWLETVSDSVCYRLYDTTNGFKSIANVADFITYKYPNMFMIDCKSTDSNTLNFADIRQYSKMLEYKGISGLYVGIIWWSVKNDKVIWIPIETLEKIKKEDKKSYNIKMLNDPNYYSFEIKSTKLRAFMKTDYSDFIRRIEEDANNNVMGY